MAKKREPEITIANAGESTPTPNPKSRPSAPIRGANAVSMKNVERDVEIAKRQMTSKMARATLKPQKDAIKIIVK